MQKTNPIAGQLDFNLLPESNIISLAQDGRVIAVEGSSKIKLFRYDDSEWTEDSMVIDTDKVIQNMKLSENGEFLIVSLSGIDFDEREVIIYRTQALLDGNK
ncbi:MAG: hypothetical protein AAFO02_22820 [Bacteroidota bacterium]